jgi:peptidoglycan/LPS O-acetylase OafA/YrhL
MYGMARLLVTPELTSAGSWLRLLAVPVPLSLLTAWLLFHYYETPFLKQKDRFV